MSRVLWQRRVLRSRERWTGPELAAYQDRQLAVLRDFAVTSSPFYRRFHHGLEQAPLGELPVLTKATMMDSFDQISTDPAVRLAGLQAYLEQPGAGPVFGGRYWVAATSGSSGRKAIIPASVAEWAAVIASYGRASEWTGVRAGPLHPVRMAVVSSATPWHQSARVAASVRSPFIATERLDAGWPLSEIVTRLNTLRPDVLVAYASMVRTLAAEQIAGRLAISPRAVNSSSDVLTAEARAMAERAWHVPPFNVYAATETGGIAAECRHHHGLHLFEDLVIPEVVDDAYQPAPPGEPGTRLLVTVLASRTIPLIRYELTDRLVLTPARSPAAFPSGWPRPSRDAPTTRSPCPRPAAAPSPSTRSSSTRSWTWPTRRDGRSARKDRNCASSSPGPAQDSTPPPPNETSAPPWPPQAQPRSRYRSRPSTRYPPAPQASGPWS